MTGGGVDCLTLNKGMYHCQSLTLAVLCPGGLYNIVYNSCIHFTVLLFLLLKCNFYSSITTNALLQIGHLSISEQ